MASDFIPSSILQGATCSGEMAQWHSALHYSELADEPFTWRASLIPLCGNTLSRVRLNADTSRGALLDQRKKKTQPTGPTADILTSCVCTCTGDLIGSSLRTVVKIVRVAQGHFSRIKSRQLNELSPDHPAEEGGLYPGILTAFVS